MVGASAWGAMDPAQRFAAATWCAGPSDPPPPPPNVRDRRCRRSRRVRSISRWRSRRRARQHSAPRGRRHVRHRRPSGFLHVIASLAPGPQRGRVNLGKSLASGRRRRRRPAAEERFVVLFPGFRERSTPDCSSVLSVFLRANVAAFRVTAATVRAAAATGRRRRRRGRSRRDGALSASAPPRTTREWKTDGWRSSPNPNRRSKSRRITSATIRVAWCTPLADFFTTACGRATAANGSRWTSASSARVAAELSRCARDYPARTARSAQTPVEVTMERPLGITFEPDTEGRARVSISFAVPEPAEPTPARLQAPASVGASAPRRGDILRAFTTSTLSYGPRERSCWGSSGTKRARGVVRADNQPWGKTISALKSGLVADGPVTLILERDRDEARASA